MDSTLVAHFDLNNRDLSQENTREFDSKIKYRDTSKKMISQDNLSTDLKENIDSIYSDDSKKLLENIFTSRSVVLNESWEFSENVQGKIVHCDVNEVYVDCLIDKSKAIFEHRSFPRYLFEHLNEVKSEIPVYIKTKGKRGSVRIDIYPGTGLVDLGLFKQKDKWSEIENQGLDTKLTEW
jgi:hypothetical protein